VALQRRDEPAQNFVKRGLPAQNWRRLTPSPIRELRRRAHAAGIKWRGKAFERRLFSECVRAKSGLRSVHSLKVADLIVHADLRPRHAGGESHSETFLGRVIQS
jgi:hypothetical protein